MNNTEQPAIRIVAFRRPSVLFEPRIWRPAVNIYETEQGVGIVAELAGIVDPQELLIYVQPYQLLIQGQRQVPTPGGLRRIQRLEIVSGAFQVEVPLTM